MAVALAPNGTAPAALPGTNLFRVSVAKYLSMCELGTLTESDKVELIDGILVKKMSRNAPHDSAISRLQFLLFVLLQSSRVVRTQSALILPRSVPEPDLAVVAGPAARYAQAHPRAADCELVAEVSESSLAFDRSQKLQAYARAALPEYWIVNLIDGIVEVYTDPRNRGRNPTYRARTDYAAGESVPVVLGGKQVGTLPVSEIIL
jgi:Uma2 family endonuclease